MGLIYIQDRKNGAFDLLDKRGVWLLLLCQLSDVDKDELPAKVMEYIMKRVRQNEPHEHSSYLNTKLLIRTSNPWKPLFAISRHVTMSLRCGILPSHLISQLSLSIKKGLCRRRVVKKVIQK